MTAGRVVLWRHGRTEYNALARMQGQVDIPLDEVGHWQAATAAAALADRVQPTRIISSDLTRARQTAEALAAHTGMTLTTDSRLRERSFGEWEGMNAAEIAARWPEQHAVWCAGREPERVGAETRVQVRTRMLEAMQEHAAQLASDEVLVLVSHGAAITLGLTGLLGQPADWRGLGGMQNAHWTEVRPTRLGSSPAWCVETANFGPSWASSDWNAGPDPESEGVGVGGRTSVRSA